MSILPTPSQVPPKRVKEAPKADLRRPITPWKALVWAYRDECVAAATNSVGERDMLNFAVVPMDRERLDRGVIHGRLDAHPDAVVIDAKARKWFEHHGHWMVWLGRYAEKDIVPPPALRLQAHYQQPALDRNGNPVMRKKKSHGKWRDVEPVLEWVICDGTAEEVEAKHRRWAEFIVLFDAFLLAMPGFPLTRWRVLTG